MNVKKLLFKALFFISIGVSSQNISLMGGDLPADGPAPQQAGRQAVCAPVRA